MQEILIGRIVVEDKLFEVVPTYCPKDGSNEVPHNSNGESCCVLGTTTCEYLEQVHYDIDSHDKTLMCSAE
jgi:hypothetical protein